MKCIYMKGSEQRILASASLMVFLRLGSSVTGFFENL